MCMSPTVIRNSETEYHVGVPCGKCPLCIRRKASAWSFRLLEEEKVSTSSHFLTFTYDDDHVSNSRNGYGTLSKRDLQLFFKKLRKASSRNSGVESQSSYKYFSVGEYGTDTRRPHYHSLLFESSGMASVVELVSKCWDKGHVYFGDVNGASIGYVLKYMLKKLNWRMGVNDDREPPFTLMSKGIGVSYLDLKMCEWHKSNLLMRMYVNLPGDQKLAMPRYYKDKLYSKEDRELISTFSKERLQAEFDRMVKEGGLEWKYNRIIAINAAKANLFCNSFKNEKL